MTNEDRRIYDRKWYALNKNRIRERKNERQRKTKTNRKQLVLTYLKTHPCVDCGENDPVVLEFDHRTNKVDSISNMLNSQVSEKKLLEEIAKCEVRCANCHRRKTAKDFNWYRNK